MKSPGRMHLSHQARMPTGPVPNVKNDDRDQSVIAIQRRKSLTTNSFARTHGLPAPDGPLHTGNIFCLFLASGRILDLGAGKGNFSLSAAELGWDVTAVDARTVRWPNAETETDPDVAERIRAVSWIQADVRSFPRAPGKYELICILGLLQHLELADQIALIRRCAGTLLLVDTRIAPAVLDHLEGYEGMAIRKHGEAVEDRNLVPTAAWGNAVSFRHTEESLLEFLRDCGYPQVMPMRPPHRRDYTFYLCLGSSGRTGARRSRQGRV